MPISFENEGSALALMKGDMARFVEVMTLTFQEPVEVFVRGENFGVGINRELVVWFDKEREGKYVDSNATLGNHTSDREYYNTVVEPNSGDFKGFLSAFVLYFKEYTDKRMDDRYRWALERVSGTSELAEQMALLEADFIVKSDSFGEKE